jgi:hypothetical protein
LDSRIKQIREFFWPVLDPLPVTVEEPEQTIDIHIHTDSLDIAFEFKKKFADNEEDRRKGVESKAALLLSSISLATSLVVGADSFVTTGHALWARIALKIILLVLCAYTLATVIYALKCLSRSSYHALGFKDINVRLGPDTYKRELIKKMHQTRKKNQLTVNEKVDSMVMAQEFYKRSVVAIGLYVFCGLIITIFQPNPPANASATLVKIPQAGDTTKVVAAQPNDTITIQARPKQAPPQSFHDSLSLGPPKKNP